MVAVKPEPATATHGALAQVRGAYGSAPDLVMHNMLGIGGLFEEMASYGISRTALVEHTGIQLDALDDPAARMTQQQKILLFRNVRRLSTNPGVGLLAGQRQRLSDFGVFGYALASSATLGEALTFGVKHVRLAGPVLEKSLRVEDDMAIFEGHDLLELGELLPLISEFWFSSTYTVLGRILERPFPSRKLLLPYPPPRHAPLYSGIFRCPVEFDAGTMQWHFDADLLKEKCPNANPITARMCAEFCHRMLQSFNDDEPELIRTVRSACLNSVGGFPTLVEVAARINVTPRTLHRRLAESGISYQVILDDVRRRLAEEYLRNTALSIEEVAARTGFSEASNFRKAYKKWTRELPADYRRRTSPWVN
jgi:AraC-like DNA-binding protein